MDTFVAKIGDLILGQGFAGACIAVVGFACWRMFSLYIELSLQRTQDAIKHIEIMNDFTAAVDKLSELIRQIKGSA